MTPTHLQPVSATEEPMSEAEIEAITLRSKCNAFGPWQTAVVKQAFRLDIPALLREIQRLKGEVYHRDECRGACSFCGTACKEPR